MKNSTPFRDLAAAQGLIAVVLFLLMPLAAAFGPGSHPAAGLLHGLGASFTLLMATYTLHAYVGYARGNAKAETALRLRLLLTNVLTLCTIVAGNWLYVYYQAPDGASEWLQLHVPAGHWVLMEYKEFVSLLAFPFGVTASVLLQRQVRSKRPAVEFRYVIGLLLTLVWLSLLIGFVFGLVLARWRTV
ncbi:hypothetical protein [Paenibacillus cremeus]|uniref:Uncharacterized protein n=1 Tax=Paenibacillus cremeus TaxID=2163881 RepID=A0A559K635_9BACL|nr:hypothetical protein [Paenibacillus cremeus]TVY07604.1 hypothetical protein FPZ49_22945 [Paenibacillus cremeus]